MKNTVVVCKYRKKCHAKNAFKIEPDFEVGVRILEQCFIFPLIRNISKIAKHCEKPGVFKTVRHDIKIYYIKNEIHHLRS